MSDDGMKAELERLRRLLEEQSKSLFLGRLMGSLVHDLNNPLTSISGNIELLLLNPQLQEAKLQKRLDAVHASARRMADKLRCVQLLTRAGKTEERFDLNGLTREVVTVAEVIPRYSKYPIHYLPYAEPLYCRANCNRLGLALIALIENAVDAIGDGFHPHLSVTVDRSEEEATVTVSDNGGGISEDLKQQIFEPFFTTREGKVGLGLYLAAKYVTESGGSLTFQSSEHGSSFTISLSVTD